MDAVLGDDEKYVLLAKIAEAGKRYEEMAQYMKDRVEIGGGHLNAEERDLLSFSYKNVMDERRHAMRVVKSIAKMKAKDGVADEAAWAEDYSTKVAAEASTICRTVDALIKNNLMPYAGDGESKVFYLKLRGDYNRYLAEVAAEDEDRFAAVETAKAAYAAADVEATKFLLHTHPVRLGLALNYSIFQHDVLDDREAAMEMASSTFEFGRALVAKMPEDAQQEAALSLQMLQENLLLWEAEGEPVEVPTFGSASAFDDIKASRPNSPASPGIAKA